MGKNKNKSFLQKASGKKVTYFCHWPPQFLDYRVFTFAQIASCLSYFFQRVARKGIVRCTPQWHCPLSALSMLITTHNVSRLYKLTRECSPRRFNKSTSWISPHWPLLQVLVNETIYRHCGPFHVTSIIKPRNERRTFAVPQSSLQPSCNRFRINTFFDSRTGMVPCDLPRIDKSSRIDSSVKTNRAYQPNLRRCRSFLVYRRNPPSVRSL